TFFFTKLNINYNKGSNYLLTQVVSLSELCSAPAVSEICRHPLSALSGSIGSINPLISRRPSGPAKSVALTMP
uniref:Uncharacterized protein n=1 Tax=Triticum urartu TaxID=4572 RepID=A0A8R7PXZ8_TRIUA